MLEMQEETMRRRALRVLQIFAAKWIVAQVRLRLSLSLSLSLRLRLRLRLRLSLSLSFTLTRMASPRRRCASIGCAWSS